MPAKRYPVLLDSEQRESLIRLISIGKDSARKLTRARILLKADESRSQRKRPRSPSLRLISIKDAINLCR